MIRIDPYTFHSASVHRIILSSVAPRPIALASTIDQDGNPNLSPFSFYNAFGINPTTIIFSPSRRGRNNTVKHTFENIIQVPEVVINAVTYNMIEQVSLASSEYPRGVNEFIKAGLTPVPGELVKPFRVKESPVQFECKVRQVIETGTGGGAGNLVICEIQLIHIREDVYEENGSMDPNKLDLAGRLGGDYYCRASGSSVFTVKKPLDIPGIGIDYLPEKIKHSKYLSGNDLGKLGNIKQLPDRNEIIITRDSPEVKSVLNTQAADTEQCEEGLCNLSKKYLEEGDYITAIKILMCIPGSY